MTENIPSFLLSQNKYDLSDQNGQIKLTFIDRTIRRAVLFIRESIIQYETSVKRSGFQQLSAPGILFILLSYVICIGLTHHLTGHFLYAGIIFLMVLSSSVNLRTVYLKAFILAFFFGFLVMAPAVLNVFVPGKILVTLFNLQEEKHFLIYRIPETVGITYEGVIVVSRMFLKVFNSLSITFLVLYSVSFDRLIRALKLMYVPDIFILIVTLSYKYIYTMALTIEEMYLALKARWLGNPSQEKARNIIAGRMGYLFKKSYLRYEEVYKAMISRGFTGEINIKSKEKISFREALILSLISGMAICICIIKF